MAKKLNQQHIIALRTPKGEQYNATIEQEQNIIGQCIAQARNRAGLSLTKLSALMESYGVTVSAGAIQKWEVGRSVPNAYQLIAVIHALQMDEDISSLTNHGCRPELNEEGQKKVAAYKADLVATGKYKPQNNIIRFIEMPVSQLAVSAGVGEFLDEGNFSMVSFPEESVPDGADFGLRITGDSMEPVYSDGQTVWVQQCERLKIGEVGIFIYDGEGYIKRYEEQEPDEEHRDSFTDSYGVIHKQPVLISYNQKYEPKAISPHVEFKVVGRVL